MVLAGCLSDNPDWGDEGGDGTTEASGTSTSTTGGSGAVTSASGGSVTSASGGTGTGAAMDVASTYRAAVIADGPVAYWPLDETTAPAAVDMTGNGFDGTYIGVAFLGDVGAFSDGSSLAPRFDGSNWVDMGDVLDFPGMTPFSVEAWFSPDFVDDDLARVILAKNVYTNQYEGLIMYHANDSVAFRRDPNGWLGADAPLTDGGWHHMVGTFDGINQIIYLDGVQVAVEVKDNSMGGEDGSFLIGSSANFTRFNGRIDEVSVYDYPLSRPQVEAHFAAGQ